MSKIIKEEQLAQLYAQVRDITANIAESNAPLVFRDLGKQMAESPNANEITLKIGVTVRCLFNSKWELDPKAEWEVKRKEKHELDTVVVDFDQPELDGLDAAEAEPIRTGVKDIETTARKLDAGEPVRMLAAKNCGCKHFKEYGYCWCDAIKPGSGLDMTMCECGHPKSEHVNDDDELDDKCWHRDCPCQEFNPRRIDDPDFHMADEVDAVQARDIRNAKKLAAKAIQAAYLGNDEKTVFILDIHTGTFVEVTCKSKAEAKRKLDGFYSDGMVRFHSLVSNFKMLSGDGFTTIIRLDTYGKRIKYTDATHSWANLVKYETADEGREHMAALMADPLVLED